MTEWPGCAAAAACSVTQPPTIFAHSSYLSLLKSRYHLSNLRSSLVLILFPGVGGRVSLEVVVERQRANDSESNKDGYNWVIIYLASLTASFGKAVLKAICSVMSLPDLERYL